MFRVFISKKFNREVLFILLIIFFVFLFTFAFADTTSTLRPTADGGDDSASWNNTTGSACNTVNCYTEVDESSGATCTNSDGDTSYIQSAKTSGISQTFDINESGITDDSTITQIDITVCYVKSGGGGTFQTRYCHNGSCSDSGVNISAGAAYAETTQSHTVNFTKTSGSDIEIGITNTATKNTRISQISATIIYTLPSDTTAPDAVSDLVASGASQTTINLGWSAPGDDGSTGTATTYDIRYSTATINDGNWTSATQATGEPTPSVASTAESFTVTGLTADTTYYLAIKTSDEVPNVSAISNIYSTTTTAASDTTTPSAVSDLALSGAITSSIDLDWTAPGDDAGSGTATTYDIRYSTATIDDGNWTSATTVIGEPAPSVAGSSESMTVSGLTAETTYYFALKTSDESSNESAISNVPSLATSAEAEEPTITISSGGGSSGGVAPSRISLSGQAYPGSKVEVLRKGSLDTIYRNIPIERSSINDDGTFSIVYLGLLGADYLIALRVEDKDGRKTGIIAFNVDLVNEDLVVEDIFVPPTVGFEDTLVKKGTDVHIVGYAAPNNIIELEIGGIKKETKSNASGFYELVMNTGNLDTGSHMVRARQIAIIPSTSSGQATEEIRTSNFGISRAFKLSSLSVPLADFNKDSKIGITDWSIFLFRWGSLKSNLRSRIDLDGNGIINIADFSIFLRAFSI